MKSLKVNLDLSNESLPYRSTNLEHLQKLLQGWLVGQKLYSFAPDRPGMIHFRFGEPPFLSLHSWNKHFRFLSGAGSMLGSVNQVVTGVTFSFPTNSLNIELEGDRVFQFTPRDRLFCRLDTPGMRTILYDGAGKWTAYGQP